MSPLSVSFAERRLIAMIRNLRAVIFENDQLKILDQSLLPVEEKYIMPKTGQDVYDAIRGLKVRGAPSIGIAAAYGLVSALRHSSADNITAFCGEFQDIKALLASARPTAVNLFRALDRQEQRLLNVIESMGYAIPSEYFNLSPVYKGPDSNQPTIDSGNNVSPGWLMDGEHKKNSFNKLCDSKNKERDFRQDLGQILSGLLYEAEKIWKEEENASNAMGELGLSLLKPGMGILTHCNAGALATAGYGTALSPIYLGQERDYGFKIFAGETRPLLQGARLTAWELMKAGVDVTLICDNMASSVMSNGWIQAVLTGCDRMAANGDGANKIGTSALAILAKTYDIPFYMFVPTSTIDINIKSGDNIPIEIREGDEIRTLWYKKPMAPEVVKTWNPAFDVTKHEYITAVITEKGIIYPPFTEGIKRVAGLCPMDVSHEIIR